MASMVSGQLLRGLRRQLEMCSPPCRHMPPQAVHVFGYAQRLKSATSGALYAALVHACLKCASPLKAQQVMYEMKAAGFVPESGTYDALLLGCARHGEPLARLQALLAMMSQEGVPRQGACYLQLVEALAGCNRHADAIEIVEVMRAQKLQPSQTAAMACLQAVQGAQAHEGAAVGEPARRLVQLLREEAAVHVNEPHRPEPSPSPFEAMIPTAPSTPPPSTPRKASPPS